MLEQPSGQNGHPGTSSDETVTVSSPVNILTLSSVTECTVNTVNSHNTHLYVNNPAQLYDTLYPLLSHQHSTITSLQHILQPIQHLTTLPAHTLSLLHQLLGRHSSASAYLPPLPEGSRPRRAPPISYTDPNDPITTLPPPLLSFPLGSNDGVGVAASTLSTPDNDAGLGLFGITPKRNSYTRISKFKHLFARKGDYICAYDGPLRSPTECISQPSMYLFSDPSDPLGRYVDSWTPEAGVTSYGGYVNEHFQDEAINCTIKWAPGQPTAGIYAKRDIRLNEELFTGYGKPQWIYTLRFFANILSPRTIQDAITRYHILPTDQLAPCLANQPNQPVLSPPQPHMPATPTPNKTQAHESAPPLDDPSPTSTTSPEIADTTTPIGASPQQLTFPHGTQEGVATAPSQMPAAGQGLYGIRPHPDATHLFAKKGQFICIYATQQHQITATQARSSQSRYMWSTNATNRHNRKALYFDAAKAHHYGKYLNDMWNAHGNNCELKWNPATGKVEVYALRDILLNEELGTDYGAPFWYQAHNGLTTR